MDKKQKYNGYCSKVRAFQRCPSPNSGPVTILAYMNNETLKMKIS